jgi:hypothetical protein
MLLADLPHTDDADTNLVSCHVPGSSPVDAPLYISATCREKGLRGTRGEEERPPAPSTGSFEGRCRPATLDGAGEKVHTGHPRWRRWKEISMAEQA